MRRVPRIAEELLLPDTLRSIHTRHHDDYHAAPRTRPMGSGLDLAARRKDCSTFPVEISLSTIQSDAGTLITSIIRDATVRKAAADALERQVQRRSPRHAATKAAGSYLQHVASTVCSNTRSAMPGRLFRMSWAVRSISTTRIASASVCALSRGWAAYPRRSARTL